jgi:hypothetical protein
LRANLHDVDALGLDIRFARTQKMIGREAKTLIRALPEEDLDFLRRAVADHLRMCRWRHLPPEPAGAEPAKGAGAEEVRRRGGEGFANCQEWWRGVA